MVRDLQPRGRRSRGNHFIQSMSLKAWGVLGATGACLGYELLKSTVSTAVTAVLVGLLVIAWIGLAVLYRCRLARMREQFSALSPEDQRRVLREVDPSVGADLQKGKLQPDCG